MGREACRATLLMRLNDGPGNVTTRPSGSIVKPSRRAANQSRTSSAPTAPTIAPARTSLGIMRGQHDPADRDDERVGPHERTRNRGHSTPIATAAAAAVVAWPDGRLA